MIPTVMLVGAAVRHWWIIVVAGLLWPLAVVVWGDIDSVAGFLGTGLLGAVNAAIGAVICTAIWALTKSTARSLNR